METSRKQGAPSIGVTWVKPGDPAGDNYLKAVSRAGGKPVVLPQGVESWLPLLDGLHGLMLTGGADIEPAGYGAERHPKCGETRPDRDRLEVEALDFCLSRGLPVLGICRGMQMVNVYFKGKLIQDIDSQMENALDHPSVAHRESRYHQIEVLPGTLLGSIVGVGAMQVNSRHHQGVTADLLGTALHTGAGLRVGAAASDGLVEAVESTELGRFLLAVQCHPERDGEADGMLPIFDALVDRARLRM